MARETRLYYWDVANSKWFYVGNPDNSGLVSDSSGSAVKEVIIKDKLGLPREAEIFITNKARNLLSNDSNKNVGYYDTAFDNGAKVMLVDEETHQVIFSGITKKVTRRVNQEEGSILRLVCHDLLQELLEMSGMDDKNRFWHPKKGASLTGGSYGVNDGTNPPPGTIAETSNSKWIQRMLNTSLIGDESYRKAGKAIIDDFDASGNNGTIQSRNKAEKSIASKTTGQVNRNLTESSLSILGHIREVAAQDPHTNVEYTGGYGGRTFATRNFGYDYFVDPGVTVPKPDTATNWVSNPDQHFNYFQRGSRPNVEPEDVGLNIIFPTSTDTFDKGVRPGTNPYQRATRLMGAGYAFEDLNDQIHTHARVIYSRSIDGHADAIMQEYEDKSDPRGMAQAAARNEVEFELLHVYNVRGGRPDDSGNYDQDFFWRGTAIHNTTATPDFPIQKWFRPDYKIPGGHNQGGLNFSVSSSTTWYQQNCDIANGNGNGQTGKLCPWSRNDERSEMFADTSGSIPNQTNPPLTLTPLAVTAARMQPSHTPGQSLGEDVIWSPSGLAQTDQDFKYSFPRKVMGGPHPIHTWAYEPDPAKWGDPDTNECNNALMGGTPLSAEPLDLYTTTTDNSDASSTSDWSLTNYTWQGIVGHVQFAEVVAENTPTGTAQTQAAKKVMLISHTDGQQWLPAVQSTGRIDRTVYNEIDLPSENAGSSSFAILRGRWSEATCRIDLSAANLWTGVPQHYLGRKNILAVDVSPEMPVKIVGQVEPIRAARNQVRQLAQAYLYRAARNIKQGEYTVQRYPYHWIDARVNAIETSGAGTLDTDKYMTIKQIDSNTAVNLRAYGIKVGDVIRFFSTDTSMTTETTYGYICSMSESQSDTIGINFPAGTTAGSGGGGSRYPNANDYIKIYSQLRTGQTIRVENTLANIAGNHMVTETEYREDRGRKKTVVKSIGEEDDNPYAPTITREYSPGERAFDVQKGNSSHTGSLPRASVTPQFSGRFYAGTSVATADDQDTYTDNHETRVSWTGGILSIGSRSYPITAGSTYTALGNLELPNVASTYIPNEYIAFYIYFDPLENETTFQVKPAFADWGSKTMFTPASFRFVIAWCRRAYGDDPKAEFALFNGAAGQFPMSLRQPAPDMIRPDTISAALHRIGTQPFSWTGIIQPVNLGQANESVTQLTMSQTGGTNPMVSFADGTSAMLPTGSLAALNNITVAGTYYLYFDISGMTKDANGQYGNTSSPVPVTRTTSYAAVNTDHRGLLAIIDKSPNDPYSLAVQTFGTKIGNINADNIAANSITANAIATGALDAETITLTSGGKMRTSATVNDDSGSNENGFIFDNTGLRGYNATGDEMFVLDPTTGKAKMLIDGSMTDQSNLNDWGSVFGTGKPANNATAGAVWGNNITDQPLDDELLNANLTLTINAQGEFTLGNGGNATDGRIQELKRKIFRTTNDSDGPPAGPYKEGDWWVTTPSHTNVAQRGTNIATSNNTGTSVDAGDWQRITPPASIMSPNQVTIDGANLTAGTVSADTISATFSLTNVLIAGTGVLDGSGASGLDGVALTNTGLYAQRDGVTQLHIAAGSDTNRGYLVAGAGYGSVAITRDGIIINEGDDENNGISWHYNGLSSANRLLTLSVQQEWQGNAAYSLGGSSSNNGAVFGMPWYSDVGMLIANQGTTYAYNVIDWNLVGHYVGPLSGRATTTHLPANWFSLPASGPGGQDKVITTVNQGDGGLDAPWQTAWADWHQHASNIDLSVNNLTVSAFIIDSSSNNSYISLANYYHDFVANNYVANPDNAIRYMRGSVYLSSTTDYGYVGINSSGSSAYNLYVSGSAAKTTGTSWTSISDDRIKTAVADVTNATTTLKSLVPKTYKFTDAYQKAVGSTAEDLTTTQYGFLASNFETVLPDYTDTTKMDIIKLSDDSYEMGDYSPKVDGADDLPDGATIETENIKTINDSALVPLLVAAIKELEARIAALES